MKYAANALSHRAHTRFARRRSSARRAREKKPGWKPGFSFLIQTALKLLGCSTLA
ncbi:conserved hypothetical protein, partial [Burkholderia pseudomallei Pakistan 9]